MSAGARWVWIKIRSRYVGASGKPSVGARDFCTWAAGWASWAIPPLAASRIRRRAASSVERFPSIPAGNVGVRKSLFFEATSKKRVVSAGRAGSKNEPARRRPPRYSHGVHISDRRRAKTRQRAAGRRRRGFDFFGAMPRHPTRSHAISPGSGKLFVGVVAEQFPCSWNDRPSTSRSKFPTG